MKTLYVTDLDGTLLNNKGALKYRAAEMLSRFIKNGVLFSYATARRYLSSSALLKDVGLRLPVITMNGAVIYDPITGDPVTVNSISEKALLMLKEMMISANETPLVYAFINGRHRVSYLGNDTSRNKEFLKTRMDLEARPCKDYDALFEGEVHYVTTVDPLFSEGQCKEMFSAENGLAFVRYKDFYLNNTELLEIFSDKATKANGILRVKELTGADEVVVFGDSENDLSMFAAADRRYAVSNAREQLKLFANGVIGSNETMSVPVFIEKEQTRAYAYTPHENVICEPDAERFKKAVEKAKERQKTTIGTLNEKCTHNALKNYFAGEQDLEAKIGDFYADAAGENGIYEIQTRNFSALNKKLEVMLSACHVTIVYPLERKVRSCSIGENTGELIREGIWRTTGGFGDLFLELYRIKSFLTDPNLTVCVAEIQIERKNFVNEKTGKRNGRGKYEKIPVALLREIYLEKPSDYRIFLPESAPDSFTIKEFQHLMKHTDARLMLEILNYMGIVEKSGRRGNNEIYRLIK